MLDNEELVNCACGSNNIKQYKPYGVASVHCKDCFVSLRLTDWNRIMRPASITEIPKDFMLVPIPKSE